jgi:hypothetical protein
VIVHGAEATASRARPDTCRSKPRTSARRCR